jgi:pimeloyl-ACP methyl ester carboxylesterase
MIGDPAGDPLVLLPGLLCDAALWQHQVDTIRPFTTILVADLTRDATLGAMAERVLRDAPPRFALAALSMGGYVAFEILRIAPHRVTRLCLMDTSARPDSTEQAQHRRGLMDLARRGRFRGVTPRLLPLLLHADSLSDLRLTQAVMEMCGRVGVEAFLRQQQAILLRPDSRSLLETIAVPTLVLVGAGDVTTPPDLAAEIAAGIPGADFRIIEGAGHLPPMERPGEISAILRAWLAATDQRHI